MRRVRSHYENLKVAPDAPPEVIRAAYKVLAQKYHPDRNTNDPNSVQIMALVNEAYRVLSDPELRRQHDEWLLSVDSLLHHQTESTSAREESTSRAENTKSHSHQRSESQTIDLEHAYESFKQSWPIIASVIAVAVGFLIVLLITAR